MILTKNPPESKQLSRLSKGALSALRETSPVEACLRCGRLLVRVGSTITIPLVEGGRVTAHICYRCCEAGELRRAA